MTILIIILMIVAFLVLTVAGGLRGVRASLLAMIGTFLGVLLVDLWQEPWGEWVRAQLRPENPTFYTWLLSTSVFFLVVLVTGLGSSVLLPEPKPVAKAQRNMRERLAGGGIGLLNGALVSSYLLYFAESGMSDEDFQRLMSSLPGLNVLHAWLPWFILALVVTTTIFIVLRGSVRLSRNAAKPLPSTPMTTTTLPTQNTASQPQPNATQRAAMDSKINDKINNALGPKK
jgi:uncharacterized membrane protein required for colicin V production